MTPKHLNNSYKYAAHQNVCWKSGLKPIRMLTPFKEGERSQKSKK